MNRKIKLLFLAGVLGLCIESAGQSRPILGIGVDLGVPTGDLDHSQSIGIGGTAKLLVPIGGTTYLTLTSGLMHFSGDEYTIGNQTVEGAALNFIPIKAGVRYGVPGGLYLEPQLGYTSISTPNSNTSATGGFTYAIGAGFMISRQVDLSARYEGVSLKNNITYPFIGFRLGYNFPL